MAKGETNVTHRIMLALSPLGTTLWKNVRGFFYTLDKRTKIQAGLMRKGSSDAIGFTRVVITPEMVGKTVAIFTAIESKKPKGDRKDPDQNSFIATVRSAGGFAGFASTEEEAILLVQPQLLHV